MLAKPKHLSVEYARQFQDASIATAYPNRPPYPDEVFSLLGELLRARPRAVLDIGCGTGDLARRLTGIADRVDAIDFSVEMVRLGQQLPGGDDARLNWTVASVEEAPMDAPYGLVTAAESLHWMEWQVVMPRLQAALAPGAYLAIIERVEGPNPWDEALLDLIHTYSTNHDFQSYDLKTELEMRGFFTTVGERVTTAVDFTQSIDDYIESMHSRNGFSRDRMRAEDAAAFDMRMREVVTCFSDTVAVHLGMSAKVIWGRPHARAFSQ